MLSIHYRTMYMWSLQGFYTDLNTKVGSKFFPYGFSQPLHLAPTSGELWKNGVFKFECCYHSMKSSILPGHQR